MADYWKSLPRKFCEFCKCWITDNKPSVEFHERGKRHKENVEKKISEVRKKGQKAFEEEKAMLKDLEAMEQAALKAYEKDLKDNPALIKEALPDRHLVSTPKAVSSSSFQSFPQPVHFKKGKTKKKWTHQDPAMTEDSVSSDAIVKEWYESVTDEGYTYYWNISTGESKWEAPEDFVSLNEQGLYQNTSTTEITGEEICNETGGEKPSLEKSDDTDISVAEDENTVVTQSAESETEGEEKSKTEKINIEKSNEDKSDELNEDKPDELNEDKPGELNEDKPKEEKSNEEKSIDAEVFAAAAEVSKNYSKVQEEKTEMKKKSPQVFEKRKSAYGEWVTVIAEELPDLELPDRGTVVIKVPTIIDNEPKFKFKEKTLSLKSGYSEPIAFKKRKVDSHKKNMRKREENS